MSEKLAMSITRSLSRAFAREMRRPGNVDLRLPLAGIAIFVVESIEGMMESLRQSGKDANNFKQIAAEFFTKAIAEIE